MFHQNLLLVSHRLWVYFCAFSLGLMVMMVMVMVTVMVMVMVMIVPEALGQVGWLHQRQHRGFHKLRAFY